MERGGFLATAHPALHGGRAGKGIERAPGGGVARSGGKRRGILGWGGVCGRVAGVGVTLKALGGGDPGRAPVGVEHARPGGRFPSVSLFLRGEGTIQGDRGPWVRYWYRRVLKWERTGCKRSELRPSAVARDSPEDGGRGRRGRNHRGRGRGH